METLSHKQKIVLSILRAQIETKGYPPSVRELAQALDTTVSTAHYHLVRLRALGKIAYLPGLARTVVVIDQGL
jgi:repressor LexA